MKASFGRVPAPSADISQTTSIGILVTSVRDAAVHLDLAAGPDDRDRTSLPAASGSFEHAMDHLDVRGLRIGWSLDLGYAVVDPEVGELARAAAEVVAAEAGVELVELDVSLDRSRADLARAGVIGGLDRHRRPGRLSRTASATSRPTWRRR